MPTSLSALRAKEYSVPKGTKRITLACGHVALYLPPLPKVNEDAYCRECDTWTVRVKSGWGPSLLRWALFLVGR